MSEHSDRRSIVMVPTYNEAENIEELARRIFEASPETHLLCVDDASPDGTGKIADRMADDNPNFHILHREGPRGYALASKEGLTWCVEGGYDRILTMDGDLSHDPAVIPALIAAVDSGAGLAIGSRYVDGGRLVVDWGPFRRAVSQLGSAYARTILSLPVRDCTSGYRCYAAGSFRIANPLELKSEGYSFLIEMLYLLSSNGVPIVEVPITYIDRQRGVSKISKKIIFEALVQTTSLGISRIFGTAPAGGVNLPE